MLISTVYARMQCKRKVREQCVSICVWLPAYVHAEASMHYILASAYLLWFKDITWKLRFLRMCIFSKAYESFVVRHKNFLGAKSQTTRWKVKAGVTVMESARKSARVWSWGKTKPKTQTNANAKEINFKRREGSQVEKGMKGEINCWGVPLFWINILCHLLENIVG